MFHLFSDLRRLSLRTRDGSEGSVDDLYFDDRDWAVRYVVADVGGFLFGRKALFGVDVIGRPDLDRGEWPVDADEADIEEAPSPEVLSPDGDAPSSAPETRRLYQGDEPHPPLILGPSGAAYTPFMAEYQLGRLHREPEREPAGEQRQADPHLRSIEAMRGYAILAEDGDRIGGVMDVLINPLDWHLRYLVADTGDWLPGRKIVLPVEAIAAARWESGEVAMDLTRHQIESSPEPDDISGLKESEDESLFRHFRL